MFWDNHKCHIGSGINGLVFRPRNIGITLASFELISQFVGLHVQKRNICFKFGICRFNFTYIWTVWLSKGVNSPVIINNRKQAYGPVTAVDDLIRYAHIFWVQTWPLNSVSLQSLSCLYIYWNEFRLHTINH